MSPRIYKIIALCTLCHQRFLPEVTGRGYCHWSDQSAEKVGSCPENIHQMENRAKMKNCESKARIQNCTTQQKFKYHCVMDELENAFVEVCAEEYIIHGFCTEYNTGGAVVQPHYGLKCSDVIPPCKQSYKSTAAYLYKGCYDIITKRKRASSTTIQTENVDSKQYSEIQSNDELDETTLIGSIISLIVITIVGIASYVLCRKRATTYFCEKSKQRKEEEHSLDIDEKSKHRIEEEHSLGDYTGFISYTVKLKKEKNDPHFDEKSTHREEEHSLGKHDASDCLSEDTCHFTVNNV